MTLNSGFYFVSNKKLSSESIALLQEFYVKGNRPLGCPPANVARGSTNRATNELIAKQRRKFRAAQKASA